MMPDPPQRWRPSVAEPGQTWAALGQWTRTHKLWTVVLALLLLGVALQALDPSQTSDAGTQAATACLHAVEALREVAAGTRTHASAQAVLDEEAERARKAARQDARYQSIAQAIVEVSEGGTQSAEAATLLVRECG